MYHLLFVKNKSVDKVWQLVAVSMAAQVLTFPVCLYYFHQFPTIFLVTNLLSVPLSTVILFTEIILLALSWIPLAAVWLGKITWCLVWLMNQIILFCNGLPYGLWNGIPASVTSTLLLYAIVCAIGFWLLHKNKRSLQLALVFTFGFVLLNAVNVWHDGRQRKIIVYNVSKSRAVDFANGNNFRFYGDSSLATNSSLIKYSLAPARVALQLNKPQALDNLYFKNSQLIGYGGKTILLIDRPLYFEAAKNKIKVDVILVSNNVKASIIQLNQVFDCGEYVFDASNSLWKIDQWKKDCVQLHLPFFSVPEQGAFMMDL